MHAVDRKSWLRARDGVDGWAAFEEMVEGWKVIIIACLEGVLRTLHEHGAVSMEVTRERGAWCRASRRREDQKCSVTFHLIG